MSFFSSPLQSLKEGLTAEQRLHLFDNKDTKEFWQWRITSGCMFRSLTIFYPCNGLFSNTTHWSQQIIFKYKTWYEVWLSCLDFAFYALQLLWHFFRLFSLPCLTVNNVFNWASVTHTLTLWLCKLLFLPPRTVTYHDASVTHRWAHHVKECTGTNPPAYGAPPVYNLLSPWWGYTQWKSSLALENETTARMLHRPTLQMFFLFSWTGDAWVHKDKILMLIYIWKSI